jgi:hypothetical protein
MGLRADTPWLRFVLAALLLTVGPAAARADEVAFAAGHGELFSKHYGGYDIAAGAFHVSNGDYLFHDGKPNDGENFLVAQIGVPF